MKLKFTFVNVFFRPATVCTLFSLNMCTIGALVSRVLHPGSLAVESYLYPVIVNLLYPLTNKDTKIINRDKYIDIDIVTYNIINVDYNKEQL